MDGRLAGNCNLSEVLMDVRARPTLLNYFSAFEYISVLIANVVIIIIVVIIITHDPSRVMSSTSSSIRNDRHNPCIDVNN